ERRVRNTWPAFADQPDFIAARARQFRLAASPGAAATILRMGADVDIRDILGAIHVPTLVAHVESTREEAEDVATRIAASRAFEVAGPPAVYLKTDTLLPQVERFIGTLGAQEPETVLATILFTDIVGSTEALAELGDARWHELLERHHRLVR